ncbi:MAG: tetratricopeptide repeat protein [Verrucomicrobiota bacterium]|nr:tetratricopeptide repeat protein [Verrucomicrobiota bacterium]
MNDMKQIFTALAVAAFCLAPLDNSFAKKKGTGSSSDAGGHIKAALELVDQRQFEPAIAEFTKALEASPDNAYAIYQNRGAMYLAVGKYAEAADDYAKALEQKSDDPRSYLGRGQANLYLGKWDDAIADLSKAIELKPEDVEAYGFRGFAYAKQNDWSKALEDYDKYLVAKPTDQVALERRAEANRNQQKLPEAISDYTKAIEQDTSKKWTLYKGRAYTYHLMKDYAKAAADYQKAYEMNPKDSDAQRRAAAEQALLAPPPTPTSVATPEPTPEPKSVFTPLNLGIAGGILLLLIIIIVVVMKKKGRPDYLGS